MMASLSLQRFLFFVCVLMVVLRGVIFVVSMFALVKSADYFTEYSSKLGLYFGISSFIIGATIVALGTSLPELLAGVYAVVAGGASSFVTDNVIGSNVANALLILGIGAWFARTLQVKTELVDVDLPFFFLSMALFVFFAYDQQIVWQEALFLLTFFVVFVLYSMRSGAESSEVLSPDMTETVNKRDIWCYVGIVLLSMMVLAVSAKYFIDSLLELSALLGISSSLLTLTVVAFGTSLPEIITSVMAIKQGNHGIAIGNVFGSNTFNLTLVTGVPAFLGPLAIAPETFVFGIPFLVLATFAAIFCTMDNKVQLWEGVGLLLLYVVFVAKLVGFV